MTMQHSIMAAEPNPAPRPAVISEDLDLAKVDGGLLIVMVVVMIVAAKIERTFYYYKSKSYTIIIAVSVL